ncbi:MmgE/PrpD family protein (plasmid) [Sulfitobacter sp. LCG007]
MTAAGQLADFAADLDPLALPPDMMRAARLHLLDAIGVGVAASSGPGQRGWVDEMQNAGKACSLAGGSASAAEAAMLNGCLIHSLEYDDTHVASVIHGSAVAAPIALAAAQEADADGAAMLAGFVIAWEAMIRIGLAAPGAFQARGVQVTSVAGAIGAALAAARVWRLDRDRMISAIGIAGSQASGMLAFLSEGASVKALNPGWAAQTGIMAARLARGGMTGPSDILENRFGPMRVFGADPAGLDATLKDLGARWYLPEAAFKLYPACHYIHPFLELTERLMADGVTPDTVETMTLHVPVEELALIAEPWTRRQAPSSGYDGKWGLPYCIALMLTDGRVDVASFEHAPRDEVVALARRMSLEPWTESGFPARFPARIETRTTDGRRLDVSVETVRGAPGREIGEDAVLAKVRANLSRRHSDDAATRIIAALLDGAAPDLAALSQAIRSPSHP